MPMLTTTIGAYPKPAYVRLPDWFGKPGGTPIADPTRNWAGAMAALGRDPESILARGVRSAVGDQVEAGIDIPTDGEIAPENYIHYHCRHLEGVTFDRIEEKSLRNDAYRAHLPTIIGPIRAGAPFLPFDYRRAQSCTDRPVKLTMPGAMTIADTTVDLFYGDPSALGRDLADALNHEVLALAAAGCRHIQIDEPLFARKPDEALSYGIEHLERAFHDRSNPRAGRRKTSPVERKGGLSSQSGRWPASVLDKREGSLLLLEVVDPSMETHVAGAVSSVENRSRAPDIPICTLRGGAQQGNGPPLAPSLDRDAC